MEGRRPIGRAACLAAAMVLSLLFQSPAAGDVPRTVIALYNSQVEPEWAHTIAHRMAELPLNHLGLIVEPRDLAAGWPDLEGRSDVRGVLLWSLGHGMADPEGFLTWAEGVADSGRRWALLGALPFVEDGEGRPVRLERVNGFLSRIGVRVESQWIRWTEDHVAEAAATGMVGFERPLPKALPPFQEIRRVGPETVAHLTVRARAGGPESHLVVTGPGGGYAAAGYTHATMPGGAVRQWLIDPFAFFRAAFGTDDLPKPDVTTLAGRRLLFSHIDGDGWTSRTDVQPYAREGRTAMEALVDRVLAVHPDIPVTVGFVAADLDPAWCGDDRARRIARRVLAMPHLEAATHTYSHPLDWRFFAAANDETPFLGLNRHCPGRNGMDVAALLGRLLKAAEAHPKEDRAGAPRQYGHQPFDLPNEILGSAAYISSFAPPGRGVTLVQWPGDALPPAEAVAIARKAGLFNLNGGNGLFDAEHPSVSHLAPVGRFVEGEWQIYAAAPDEHAYTVGRLDRRSAFRHVERTFRNSGSPRRLKPVNVHYHVSLAERSAGLNALLAVLDQVRRQELIPVHASTYAAIADGFFRTRLVEEGEGVWRVLDRGALQTLRFDGEMERSVDFGRSRGVIGQRREQGSLYVALDPAEPEPVVALGDGGSRLPPHLEQSRWAVRQMRRDGDGLRFLAYGFGAGDMVWRVAPGAVYTLETADGGRRTVRADAEGRLALTLPGDGAREIEAILIPTVAGEGGR